MRMLTAVVPVYNEESILPELNSRLVEVLGSMPLEWRIVYVDDGSRDGTPRILADLAESESRVGVVHLSRNFGQQEAISAGLAVAPGDAVVVLDGDLQDPPEVIPSLVEEWEAGYRVVYAIKRDRKEGPVKRWLFSSFYWLLRKLSPLEIPSNAGNFSLMDRSVVDLINRMPERHRYVSGLRAYVGGPQIGVEFERAARYAGDPRQSPRKLLRMASDALFAFSDLPLRAASFMGFVVSGVAFVVLVDVLYKRLVTGEAILGWASVMTSVLFLGGIQLIALGVIGEYIGRIYDETKGRPSVVVARYRNLPAGSGPAALPRLDGE
ncbi:MAG: glycosyltransferase family 2 protein [Candidatus Palauibacterales bacterium]|nr:glycosyltransferase family 2 protein [Candidatus Palauibacterales bacterium]MDP2583954.1 glycosyltransferase family 2 protein [Candidatus Palauibacterales bacterium]